MPKWCGTVLRPGGYWYLPARDPEGVRARLSKQFLHEKKGIHGFYSQMEQVISALWGGEAPQSDIT